MVLQAVALAVLGCSAPSPSPRPEARSEVPAARPSATGARWGGLAVVERGRGAQAVVLLHGYGAPGDDLVSLGEQLADDVGVRFVMPAAPLRWAGGGSGRMWFEREGHEIEAQVASAGRALDGVTATLRDEGAARVVLAGFSQGAMMSLERALRGESRPDAIVLLSGAAPPQLGRDFSRLRGMPVFVSHGRQDRILPFEGGEELARRAEAAGAQVTFVPFDGGHEIPPVVVTRLGEFLRGALGD